MEFQLLLLLQIYSQKIAISIKKLKIFFIGYDSNEFKGNLKLIYKSDKYNIMIFEIEIKSKISYLKIDKYKKESSYFFLLINGKPLNSLENYIIQKIVIFFNIKETMKKHLY